MYVLIYKEKYISLFTCMYCDAFTDSNMCINVEAEITSCMFTNVAP